VIEFVDIAGLVKGASEGEGLGNKFLSHIREVDAIAHVVRNFEDSNITHVHNRVNPLEDAEIINTELVLADLQVVGKRLETTKKSAKGTALKEMQPEIDLLQKSQNNCIRLKADDSYNGTHGVRWDEGRSNVKQFSGSSPRIWNLCSITTVFPRICSMEISERSHPCSSAIVRRVCSSVCRFAESM
jgi:ribosome-binding ATPase YchF (GTP1/OBG family)